MKRKLEESILHGSVHAIPSKSDLHRLLICAALADAPTTIDLHSEATLSNDIVATVQCLRAMGADITLPDSGNATILVKPIAGKVEAPLLDCGESGSTLRFLLPVAAVNATRASFTGSGRLPERPVSELLDAMAPNGVTTTNPKLPFSFAGELHAGTYTLPGNVSSQYITGLLLALPRLPGDSEIVLTTALQSASYVDITIHSLEQFGIQVERTETGWKVPGNQTFQTPGLLTADGDWSNSGFWLVAGALMDEGLTVEGLDLSSPQGDKATLDVLRDFGAEVQTAETASRFSSITVKFAPMRGTTVDLSDIPDALPILAVLASQAQGETHFINGERLRIKESDRIHSVWDMITSLGGQAEEQPDGLIVHGTRLQGGTVDAYNDHRIVMATAIAALICDGPVIIDGAEAANKSYPSFFDDYNTLGGNSYGI